MHVSKAVAEGLFNRAEDNYYTAGVHDLLPANLLDEYTNLLNGIAAKSQYKEGERIMDRDLTHINRKVEELLTAVNNNLTDRISQGREIYADHFSALLATTDFLFATAQQTLGSPDMPTSFGPEIQNKIKNFAEAAEFAQKQEKYSTVDGDAHFRKQRKMDAEKVKASNKALESSIKLKTASPLDIAKYAAEYKALQKRQNNHTAFWRFFHRDENKARMELLQNMKSVLGNALGEGVDVDTKTPQEIAKAFHHNLMDGKAQKAFADDALGKRLNDFDSKKLQYEATDETRAIDDREKSEIQNELRQALENELKEKTNPNDESILYYVDDDEPELEKDSVGKSIS